MDPGRSLLLLLLCYLTGSYNSQEVVLTAQLFLEPEKLLANLDISSCLMDRAQSSR